MCSPRILIVSTKLTFCAVGNLLIIEKNEGEKQLKDTNSRIRVLSHVNSFRFHSLIQGLLSFNPTLTKNLERETLKKKKPSIGLFTNERRKKKKGSIAPLIRTYPDFVCVHNSKSEDDLPPPYELTFFPL